MKKNNPILKSIAMKYDESSDNAPIIVASGKGEIAKKILKIAKENKIPIKEESDSLVSELLTLPVGDEIPPHLYQIIAEIIAFIYRIDKQYAARHK